MSQLPLLQNIPQKKSGLYTLTPCPQPFLDSKVNFCNGKIFSTEFTQQENLKIHHESVHKKVKHSCNLCQYKATQQGNLMSHIESVHETVKYPCDQCEYKSTGKRRLNTHIKSVHEKVKYPCNLCGKQFTLHRNLKTHIESVHKKSSTLVINVNIKLQHREI